ncbi:MAG TPA: hypothetical protein VGI33_10090 [Paenibacillus sp.]|jgi:hypothetical protein
MRNFGRVAELLIANRTFSMDSYAMEAKVSFDNNALPNESEIKIWNLSDKTLNNMKQGEIVKLNAGYVGDVGLILQGFISKAQTLWEGVDKVTSIFVVDRADSVKGKEVNIVYAKNTRGSYIIKQMADKIHLPIAQMSLNVDYQYKEGYTAKGTAADIIAKVAKDCGTSVFINKGKLYVRSLRRGGDNVFTLSKESGLIGTPERFEEAGAKGFNVQSQLQHRITTASVIDLTYSQFEGRVYVRSGSHHISRTGDFTTEMEVIL